MPLVAEEARCIAPDLIGFGQSGKPDIGYRFDDHVRYVEAFLDKFEIESAYLVAQDWGAALAFELAARRPNLVKGLVFMEFVRPYESWEEFASNPQTRRAFERYRSDAVGEQLIVGENAFVERVLPTGVLRGLTADEMAVYRAPFMQEQSRKPVWVLPNEIPIEGEPLDVAARLENAFHDLIDSRYPKVLFAGDPGALVSISYAEKLAALLRDCRLIKLEGIHYLQEDHPELIGEVIAQFISECEGRQQT